MEAGGLAGFGVKFNSEVAAVFEKLDAGKRGAEFHIEMTPMASVGKSRGHAPGGVTEKTNGGNTAQQTGFPQNKVGVKMADDGVFDMPELGTDGFITPQKRQRRRVVAKKEDTLAGFQGGKGAPDFIKVLRADLMPFGTLIGPGVGFINRKRDEGRSDAEQNVIAEFDLPEGAQTQVLPRALETPEQHAAAPAKKTEFAKLVVAKGCVKV